MSKKNANDYIIGDHSTIEDADLDELEIYYQGERLTEARAAELGEIAGREAAQSRDARTANLIPGGKSLSGGGKHSPVIQVRVSEETRDKVVALAETLQVSVSRLIREIIDEYVNALDEAEEATRRRRSD